MYYVGQKSPCKKEYTVYDSTPVKCKKGNKNIFFVIQVRIAVICGESTGEWHEGAFSKCMMIYVVVTEVCLF